MNINFRRFLAFVFIGAFILLLPIILNSLRGYRYDTQRNIMVMTGGISVDSKPRHARVYVDGKTKEPNVLEKILTPFKNVLGMRKLGGTTPTIFQNLVPDEYSVLVTRDGYQDWQKKIDVYPERVTFLENINLFLENPKITPIVQDIINQNILSPDGKSIIYLLENSRLMLANLSSGDTQNIYTSNFELELSDISFSPDNLKIFLKDRLNSDYIFIDLANFANTKKLSAILNKAKLNLSFKNLVWDKNNSNYLYLVNNKIIYQINLSNETVEPFHHFAFNVSSSIIDFYFDQDDLWVIQKNNTRTELKKFRIEKNPVTADFSQVFAAMPREDNYTIKEINKNLATIKNTRNNNIFIVDLSVRDIEKSIISKFFAREISWDKSYTRILYWDDFEVGIVYPNRDISHLGSHQDVLFRYGQKVLGAFWSQDENFIIFGLENELKTIELDGRDKRNVFKIYSPEKIYNLFVDNKNLVYLIGQIDSVTGAYKIEMQ